VGKQYVDYLKGVATFNLGPSFYYQGRSVTEVIAQGFPVTAKLSLLSLLIVFVMSVPMGVMAAMRRNKMADRVIMVVATLGRTIPAFVLGTLLIYFLSYKLRLFPIYGIGTFQHYVLPAVALSMASISHLTRLNRPRCWTSYIRTISARPGPRAFGDEGHL
jgi:oligopeptide transport system permease protein